MIIAAYILLVIVAVVLLSRTHLCIMALLALGLFAIAHVSPLLTCAIYVAAYAVFWVIALLWLGVKFRPGPVWKRR